MTEDSTIELFAVTLCLVPKMVIGPHVVYLRTSPYTTKHHCELDKSSRFWGTIAIRFLDSFRKASAASAFLHKKG